jgi:very-short-patch-repair endonuclease
MNKALDDFLSGQPVATRKELLALAPSHVIDHAIRRGELKRVLPRAYMRTGAPISQPDGLLTAALRFVGGQGALSHTTAVRFWGLPGPDPDKVHVTVPDRVQPRTIGIIVVHRRRGFSVGHPQTVVRSGLEVVRLERAVVESWGTLDRTDERRAPVIAAVNDRRSTVDRLFAEAASIPNLPGRSKLLGLLDLLRDGCRSELEVWGHLHVFNHPGLPYPRRQLQVKLGARTIYLDVAYEAEKVIVELDDAKHHFGPDHRERDMRRDAALAMLGWLTLRFSHNRLVTNTDQLRRELLPSSCGVAASLESDEALPTQRAAKPDATVRPRVRCAAAAGPILA